MNYLFSHPSPKDMPVIRELINALMKVVPTYFKSTTMAVFCRSEMKVENADNKIGPMISITLMTFQGSRK